MLWQAIMKTLETNEKIEILSKEIEDTKKNKMEILELKITKTKIKNSMNGLNRRMEGQKNESMNLEIPDWNNRKQTDWKNKASITCGTIPRPRKRGKENGGWKSIQKIIAKNFSNLAKENKKPWNYRFKKWLWVNSR